MKLLVVAVIAVIAVISPALGQTVLRAQARVSVEDCLCQCASFSFRDRRGQKQGNCASVDKTKVQWCYLESLDKVWADVVEHYSRPQYRRSGGISSDVNWSSRSNFQLQAQARARTTCQDHITSKRYPRRLYGYHACATPEYQSRECERAFRDAFRYGGIGSGSGGGGYQDPPYQPPYQPARPTPRPPSYRPTRPPYNRPRPWSVGGRAGNPDETQNNDEGIFEVNVSNNDDSAASNDAVVFEI